MKKALIVALALVASALGLTTGLTTAGADGTEKLGPPSIPIADGTGFAIGGKGLLGQQAGSFTVDVPAGVSVEQVLIYWGGQHSSKNSGDPNITVNGTATPGTKIGGPTRFYKGPINGVYVTAYRADITSRNLVAAGGTTTFNVANLSYDYRNSGVGVIVIYDDGSAGTAQLVDGLDLAYYKFAAPLNTTVPQTFTFASGSADRVADLVLHVGDIGQNRPNRVVVTSGGQTQNFDNVLHDTKGQEWDAVTLPVDIPAGATNASVQVLSYDDPSSLQPASLEWVAAGLAVPPAGPVCDADPATALGRSRAYGISATVLGQQIIEPQPDTDDPTNPQSDPDPLIDVNVFQTLNPTAPTIVHDALFDVEEAETGAGPVPASGHATAVANHLDLIIPGVVHIFAETVRAEAHSEADGSTATSSTAGSLIQDLYIDDLTNVDPPVLIGDVSEPANLSLGMPGDPPAVQIDLLERIRTNAANGVPQPEGITSTTSGVYKSGLIVNGIHVQVPDLGIDVVVSHADTYAQAAADPSVVSCEYQPSLFGEAFTAYVGVGGRQTAAPYTITPGISLTTGFVKLPSTGGADAEHVLLAPPFGLFLGNSHTVGDLGAATASSHAQAAQFDVLNAGFIVGDLVTSDTTSTAGGNTGNATLANLYIDGNDVCAGLGLDPLCRPAPNTPLPSAPPGTLIMLNEQVANANGSLTVNAVHVWIIGSTNPLGLPIGAEVILSSATSDYVPAPPGP